MKKLVALTMSAFLLAQSTLPIFAVNQPQDEQYVYANGILIQETVNENHQVIRTYTPQTTSSTYSTRGTESTPSAEDILEAMGLEQSFIDNMRPETLAVIQNSDYITTTVSYTRTDAEGNTYYISEEQANTEIEAIKANTSATTFANIEFQDFDEDEYMRVWHMVVHDTSSTDGTHLFCTAGRWLKEPHFQSWDSVGSIAHEIAYDDTSGYGYYTADEVHTIGSSETTFDDYLYEVDSEYFSFLKEGDWRGSAMIFEYPEDWGTSTYGVEYSDVKAYYEFEGKIIQPEHITNFNSVGTYSHSRIILTATPTLTIGASSTDGVYIDACIQLQAVAGHDDRSIVLLVQYNP